MLSTLRHPSSWSSLRPQLALAKALLPHGARHVETWLHQQLDRVHDPAFATGFPEPHPLPGLSREDYQHRVVDGDFGRLLGGIRFFGGDVARPFVELIAWSGDPGWSTLVHRVASSWAAFQPLHLRVLLTPDQTLPLGATIDQTVHGGSYCAMAAISEVSVHPCSAVDEAHAAIARRYQQLAHTHPDLARDICPATREELTESAQAGSLFSMHVDERSAGYLATYPDAIAWMPGDVMLEEVVHLELGGRGIAAKAQAALATHRYATPERLLIGTIDGRNAASRRSAERAGRPERLRYVFVPLRG